RPLPAAATEAPAPAPIRRPTRISSHGTDLRSRLSSATFESEARPTVSAHAAVSLSPIAPRQYARVRRNRSTAHLTSRTRRKCADFSGFLLQSLGAAETIDGI